MGRIDPNTTGKPVCVSPGSEDLVPPNKKSQSRCLSLPRFLWASQHREEGWGCNVSLSVSLISLLHSLMMTGVRGGEEYRAKEVRLCLSGIYCSLFCFARNKFNQFHPFIFLR